jgi:hypothetical protein
MYYGPTTCPAKRLGQRAMSLRGSDPNIVGPEIMIELSRRSFLASSVAAAAHPAFAFPASSRVDVIVIGAGAAGIAAARRVVAAGGKLAVFEATDRVGGRCYTDTRTFDIPYDRGAHWIHMPDTNPVAKLGLKTGGDIYAAPPSQRLRIGLRYARDGEMEDFFANIVALQSRHRERCSQPGRRLVRAGAAARPGRLAWEHGIRARV